MGSTIIKLGCPCLRFSSSSSAYPFYLSSPFSNITVLCLVYGHSLRGGVLILTAIKSGKLFELWVFQLIIVWLSSHFSIIFYLFFVTSIWVGLILSWFFHWFHSLLPFSTDYVVESWTIHYAFISFITGGKKFICVFLFRLFLFIFLNHAYNCPGYRCSFIQVILFFLFSDTYILTGHNKSILFYVLLFLDFFMSLLSWFMSSALISLCPSVDFLTYLFGSLDFTGF